MSQVITLYTDKEKTDAIYPRTKISGISDDNNVSLQELLNKRIQITDVQVDGISVISNEVANIPIGNSEKAGAYLENYNNELSSAGRGESRVITGNTLDYAVKTAMCDGKGTEWADAEKSGAWKRLNSIKTSMGETAIAGAQYYLGEVTELNIVLPTDAEVGQTITVTWYNGATPATLNITGTMLTFGYTPSANARSEINALWDGTYWTILGNEMKVPTE